ncbi:hypothetical protein M5G07_09710 [Serratia symbiotica]|nr:hypothetical protein [Serratia symbiotica]
MPGNLILNAARIINPDTLVGKKVQLTIHALQNTGRLEVNNITLNGDTLDNAATLDNTATLMGEGMTSAHRYASLISTARRQRCPPPRP